MQKIELSSAHSGRRTVLAVALLAAGIVALVYAFTGLFAAQKGWQEVVVSSDAEANCGGDFVLLYDLGASDMGVSAEKRALTSVYTGAAVTAYRLFESGSVFDGVNNVGYINQHPNEIVDVDPALYRAFAQIQDSGDRSLYLGPVYELYNGLFSCDSDGQTVDFDPLQNEALRAYFDRCAAYGRDPASVDLELLGGDQVRLNVSEEYLAFAREQEIGCFLDLYWMKNAFIIDYLADTLAQSGFTRGALSSFDGFVRNLYDGEEAFGLNVYDRTEQAGTVSYHGPMSIVYLRGYPMNSLDARHYYEMDDGQVRTAYVDPADGLPKAAWGDLLVCTGTGGCGEATLALAPIYVADRLDKEALLALSERGVFSLYCEQGEILCNDPELVITAAEGYTVAQADN